MKFLLDEHVPRAVALGLRQRGVDAVTVRESGTAGEADVNHLSAARAQERIIVTQDDDFLRLHAQGMSHAGIVFVPRQSAIGTIVRGLMLIQQVLDDADMRNHVEFLI